MEKLVVEAQPRERKGKNAARQLRRAGRLPAVIYGGKQESLAVSVEPRAVERIMYSESGHNTVFTLAVKGKGKTPAMVRDWQMEPVKGSLLHVDFLRVALDERLRVKVPMHTRGEAKGVKQEGGILEVIHREVEIECLPTDIPEEFVVDVSELGINQSIRAKDLPIDASKLRLLTDANQVLVHVVMPRAVEEEKPAEEVVVEEGAAEPEVIGKGKTEKAEGEAEEASTEGEKK